MTQPNIIFIFSDQQRYNTMGCTGNAVIRTPAFDRLAAEGVLFRQAFSSCPICSPYRAQILTGCYSHKNGVLDNEYKLFEDQTTLAQALKASGYRTGYVGKWHLGYGPYTPGKRYGFDYMAAYDCQHHYFDVAYWENETGPIKIEQWAPAGETDLAIRFMQNHRKQCKDKPFLLMLSWGPPHWPYEEYPQEYALYRPEMVDVPPNVPEQMKHFAQKEIAHYYGNITGLDTQMGRLMNWLEENGLREDTILCFSSDHGDHLSSHGYGKPMDAWLHHSKRASKATPYEESIHIPFILSYPKGVDGGTSTDTLFSSVDVMPTLLSLAGVDIPNGVQGQDLSHAALGNEGPQPDSVYLQILGPGWPHRGDWVGYWRGLRTQRWLYARWFGGGDVWLFDRENDPHEINNLAGNPEYALIQEKMEQRLQQWIEDTADPFETGERDPTTGMLCLGQEFTHMKWKRC
jgi:arylsulfatase A-like enzyme